MTRILAFVACVCVFFPVAVSAQTPVLLDSIVGFSGSFTTDPIGNLYRYSRGDLTKYSSKVVETNHYSRRDYGDIGYVEAFNPMKILVVYPEFSRALVLDASLAVQSDVSMTFPGIPFIRLVCLSREAGFWMYDPMGRRLMRVNDQLSIIAEGTPLNQVSDRELDPAYLGDSGDWLVLYVPGDGILVFDRYGTYYKTLRDTNPLSNIRASGNEVIYQTPAGMSRVDIRTGTATSLPLPPEQSGSDCRVEGNRMYIRTGDVLKIYGY